MLKHSATWIADHELWIIFLVSPLLLFPWGLWPYLGLGIICLTWIARRLARGRFSLPTTLDIPILIILLMAGIGLLISIEPALSYTRFWSLLLGVTFYYAVVNTLQIEDNVTPVAVFLALLTISVAFLSLVGTDWHSARMVKIPWIYDHIPTLVRNLPNSGVQSASDLFNPRWIGITMGFLTPVSLTIALFGQGRKLRLLCGFAAFVGTATLLLSQSLQGIIGLVAGLLFLAIWRNRWFLLLIPLGVAILTTGVLILDPLRVATYLLSVDNPVGIGIVLRLDMWSRALAMIQNLPYTGIGLNMFQNIQRDFYPGYILGLEPHAHNLYLQTALDLGLPGLFAFLWLFATWFYTVWKNYHLSENRAYRVLLAGLVAGIFSYLAHGFIDTLMLGAKPSVAVWILLGLGAQPPLKDLQTAGLQIYPAFRRPILRLLPLILLAGAILLSLVLKPAALPMNLGSLLAHRALYQAHTTGIAPPDLMESAQSHLLRARDIQPDNVYTNELLGRIYAWQAAYPQSQAAFTQRVVLDMNDPFRHYYPPESYLRSLQKGSPETHQAWDDLLKIYSNWMHRYPTHAEHYIRVAKIWQLYKANPEQAARVLTSGIENGAQPTGLLRDFFSQIQP